MHIAPLGSGLALLALMITTACSGGGTDPTPTPATPTPTIALTIVGTSATVQQGGTALVQATVTRGGSYTGTASLAVDGLPAGVTSAVSNVVTAAGTTTATITLTVAATAATATSALTVRATGTGVADATAPFALTVTPAVAGAYTLAATGVAIVQGSTGQSIVTIARTGGFAGSVALAIEGAPNGLATTLTPNNTTGVGAVLSLVSGATLAAGTYTLTLRGTTPGLADRTTTITVVVTAPAAGNNVRLDFSLCGSARPIWIAYQDGTGSWTRIQGTNDVYPFTIASPTAGYAYVTQTSAGSTTTNVRYLTRAELMAAPLVFCPALTLGTKLVSGTASGLVSGQAANIALGGAFNNASSLFTTFILPGIPAGAHDLVAYRQGGVPSIADRVIVRRDLDPPAGSALALLDFAGTEAVAPATATVTLAGLAAGEGMSHTMSYLTGAACDVGLLYTTTPLAAAHAMFGIAAATQRATDYHLLRLAVATSTTSRTVQESFHTLAARTVTLGAPLGAPAITTLAGPYKRLQAAFTLPAEYSGGATLYYLQTAGTPRLVYVGATPGAAGGTATTLSLPDFSSVTGWSNTWAPATTATTPWTITAGGTNVTGSLCAEGGRVITVSASGQS